jgi:hypothetical protein
MKIFRRLGFGALVGPFDERAVLEQGAARTRTTRRGALTASSTSRSSVIFATALSILAPTSAGRLTSRLTTVDRAARRVADDEASVSSRSTVRPPYGRYEGTRTRPRHPGEPDDGADSGGPAKTSLAAVLQDAGTMARH